MNQIKVTLYVSPMAAVRAGKAQCGDVELVLSEADVASLTELQREALANHFGGSSHGLWTRKLTDYAPEIGHADLGVLAKLLDDRRAYILTESEKEKEREEREAEEEEAQLEKHRAMPIEELANLHIYYSDQVGRTAEVVEYRAAQKRAAHEKVLDLVREQIPQHEAQFVAGLLPEKVVNGARNAKLAAMLNQFLPERPFVTTIRSGNTKLDEIDVEKFPFFSRIRDAAELVGAKVAIYPSWRDAEEDERGDEDNEVLDPKKPVAYAAMEIAGDTATASAYL